MILEWKTFKINLFKFKEFLDENIPFADGIVASEENFVIIEKIKFEQDDINLILNYYNSLTEEDNGIDNN